MTPRAGTLKEARARSPGVDAPLAAPPAAVVPPRSRDPVERAAAPALGRWLVDAYGRHVTDVRVSLTDRCNFNCVYCHNEGLGDTRGPREPSPGEMTTDEVVTLLHVAREFDVTRAKFTGGEPLLRQDLEDVVRAVSPFMECSVTTNGSLLAARARPLADAGLARVNVSVDALDPAHFEAIRRGRLDPVLRGIDAALDAGLSPVKVNTVVMDDTLDELSRLVAFASSKPGLELQLIEVMPEIRSDMLPHRVDLDRVRRWLAARADRVETREMHHRRIYHVGPTRVEIVDPVENAEFCANCHRIRVTPDGRLKGCLNRLDDYVPTRGLDRDGIRDAFYRVVRDRVPYYGAYDRAHRDAAHLTGPLPADGAERLYRSLRAPLVRSRPGSERDSLPGREGSPARTRAG